VQLFCDSQPMSGMAQEGHRGRSAVALYMLGPVSWIGKREERIAYDQSTSEEGAQAQAEEGKGARSTL
jgi:hypothetical protein